MCVCSDLVANDKHILIAYTHLYSHYEDYGISVALLSFQHQVLPAFLVLALLVNCSDILFEF